MEGSREVKELLQQEGVAPSNYAAVEMRRSSLIPTPNERAAIEKVLTATEERRRHESKVLYSALLFCLVFMIVEFFCGVIAHSLALLTDASHLLIDVGAYALSIMSLKAASKTSCGKYSYGWHRAEVIGTLVSVFSIWALVVWISIEGVTRMWDVIFCSRVPSMIAPEGHKNSVNNAGLSTTATSADHVCREINSPIMLLVGVLGLVVNIVCAAILHYGGSHGHSHFGMHGHSHSHGEVEAEGHNHSHNHSHGEEDDYNQDYNHNHSHYPNSKDNHHGHDHNNSDNHTEGARKRSGGKKTGFAVHAALLHALGDCIQSIGVILAGAFIYIANHTQFGVSSSPYSAYNLADPLCSLLFAIVTLNMTRPLVSDLLGILMESTPPGVDYEALNNALLRIDGVVSVHDLHVWSLSAEYTALSVHLVADDASVVLRKAQYVCEVLFGIPHTTIQVDAVANGADLCQRACASPTTGIHNTNR